MGSTGIMRYFGSNQAKRNFLNQELTGANQQVIASSMVGSVYYAAIEQTDNQTVIGTIVPTHQGWDEFTYRIYSEFDGLNCYYNCPQKILKQLTPTEDAEALRWRQNCRLQRKRLTLLRHVQTAADTIIIYQKKAYSYDQVKHRWENDWHEVVHATTAAQNGFTLCHSGQATTFPALQMPERLV